MFAELMGKDEGTNRGRGGSMHIADPTLGIFGANGIVAAGLPIAVGRRDGRAAARRRRRRGGVLRRRRGGPGRVPRSGQPRRGVAAPGGLLLREQRLRRVLPGVRASTRRRSSTGPPGTASGYVAVDGNDVEAIAAAMADAVAAARAGRGPRVVEAATYRWHGHYEGDPERYRIAGGGRGVEGQRPARASRARAAATRAWATTSSPRSRRRWPPSSTRRSTTARGSGEPGRRAR